MPINIREVRAALATKLLELEARAPVASKAKDIVEARNVREKEYQAAIYARFGGAFATQAELIAFLEAELSSAPLQSRWPSAGMASSSWHVSARSKCLTAAR